MLDTQASKFRRLFPREPEGYYYGATALFAAANGRLVQDHSPTTACQLLAAAHELLETGNHQPGKLTEHFEQTTRQVERAQQSECST